MDGDSCRAVETDGRTDLVRVRTGRDGRQFGEAWPLTDRQRTAGATRSCPAKLVLKDTKEEKKEEGEMEVRKEV